MYLFLREKNRLSTSLGARQKEVHALATSTCFEKSSSSENANADVLLEFVTVLEENFV